MLTNINYSGKHSSLGSFQICITLNVDVKGKGEDKYTIHTEILNWLFWSVFRNKRRTDMGLTRKYQNASLRLHTCSILGPVQKLPPHFFPLSFFFLNHSPFFPKRTLLCANCLQCSFKFINKDVLPSKEAGIYKHKMLLGF